MKTFVVISLFLITSLAYAQDRFRFEHFNTEDGLAHIAVNSILQDRYGYLWVGTWNGLSRYDGYRFRNYTFDPNDPLTLTHGTIYNIKESADGELWAATEGGLDRYIREEDRFMPYVGNCKEKMPCGARFYALEFDRKNRLWTNNWFRFDSQNNFSPTLQVWENEEKGFESTIPIRFLKIFNNGRYWWIPKTTGLILFEPETQDIYPAPEIFPVLEQLWDNSIAALAKGPQADVWIATDKGCYVYEKGKLRYQPGWPTQGITSLLADSYGGVWMGTQEGLYYQPSRSAEVKLIQHDPLNPSSLSANEVNCLYEDRQGNLWVGTERGGLNKIQISPDKWFQAFTYQEFQMHQNSLTTYALLKTKDNKQIWAGTNQGVFVFDAQNNQLIKRLHATFGNPQIRSLYEDAHGNIWIGSWNGNLFQIKAEDRTTFSITTMPKASGSIRKITADFQHHVWTGSGDLRQIIDESRFRKVFTELPSGTPRTTLPYIWDFQFVDSCHVWAAANQGIFYVNVCEDSVMDFHYFKAQGHEESMAVFDVFWTNKNILWAGLWGGGLARYDVTNRQARRYGPFHGLPGNHVYGILEDGQNQLWLSTDHGIARFNPTTERFFSFTKMDGLMSNEFDSGAFFEAEDGEMFFGGGNGFVRFRPWEIPADVGQQTLEVRLTSFRLSGKDFQTKTPIEALDSIEFYFERNQILEFSFSAFDFSRLGETQYKYRLLGFEENWSPPTDFPGTRYTDLSPGKYTLEIMASNVDGFYSPQIKQVQLDIRPLLIQKTWFLVLMIASAIFLLSLLVYIRTRRLNRRERTLLQYKAALAKQEALAAQFDHHFTFNSLNSIQRFVIEKENKQAIRYISRFGKLIRRVMHQARQNAITIEDEMQTLELYLSLEQLRVRHPFTYDIQIDKHIDPFTAEIPTMLIQPYIENAIWHGLMPAEKPGHIALTFERKGKYILIQITDNGIGRKKSAELKEQSSMKHESRGMALARERLESLHLRAGDKGSLQIHDLYDEEGIALGTRVELKVPIRG
jgi:ligand-binding sensor domain-containing protein